MWSKHWSTEGWREFLASGESEAEIAAIRKCTHTGRPLGTPEFIESLEQATLRRLARQKGGRRVSGLNGHAQTALAFGRSLLKSNPDLISVPADAKSGGTFRLSPVSPGFHSAILLATTEQESLPFF